MHYLDYNATTPIDSQISAEIVSIFNEFGNPSSSNQYGLASKKIIDKSKIIISNALNCEADEILYTSGATESINLALKGLALSRENKKKHIITCVTEHKAVLETCKYLESIGFEVEHAPVNDKGEIDLELLTKTIRKDTLCVCLMWVNNETGVIHPIEEIGKIVSDSDAYFVCDGTQAVGKIVIDVKEANIDILCFSGHKMYAPKGIGGMHINKTLIKNNKIQPLIHGGGQQNGLRSGTENTPLIAGLGKAFEIVSLEMDKNKSHIEALRNKLEVELLKIEGVIINAYKAKRIYNTTNVHIPNFDSELFIGMNKDIAVSSGSACNSMLVQPSHVLLSMGLTNEEALSSLRISLGKHNNMNDIEVLTDRIHNFMEI